jgi:UDP-N-acetylglucosamine 2-epimerase
MADENTTFIVNTGDGERRVDLWSYLDAEAAERAEREANAWIKSLREVPVDGVPLRDRFLFRGDSLWWFAELYLHKRRVVVAILRTLHALESLLARERPDALRVAEGDLLTTYLARQFALTRQVPWGGPVRAGRVPWRKRAEPHWRGALYAASAWAERFRPGTRHRLRTGPVPVAAFVHSAFWRQATDDESYIGPVLREVAALVGTGGLALVGVGARTNFKARTWRQRCRGLWPGAGETFPFGPASRYASGRALAPSDGVWRDRHANRQALLGSERLRAACVFHGCDAWPLLRDELTGVSHLQFPWSARAMDEIGAALDALRPRVAITYAEAGGSGRALVLEARRRGIKSVGLQHGFIYRHWLNYLHEQDEMEPSPRNPSDGGFPRPTLTLVYDRFAAEHLTEAGRFPSQSIRVTGSPKLDAFAETGRLMDDAARAALRAAVGAGPGQHLVVVATKYTQIAGALGPLIAAVRTMPDVRLVIKCHPAESGAPYERAAGSAANVTIAPASADLARLVAAASLLVTVNSTAAIEAMPLDVPALVVALPNNLSPFVEAGAVAGAVHDGEIGPTLRALLYDQKFRDRLGEGRRAFMARYGIAADGRAAQRAAGTIVELASD